MSDKQGSLQARLRADADEWDEAMQVDPTISRGVRTTITLLREAADALDAGRHKRTTTDGVTRAASHEKE